MGDWFVRVEFDAPATDSQAHSLAVHIGSTVVDHEHRRTGVRAYVTAASLRQAVSDGLERVYAVATAAGFDGTAVEVEAKTEEGRIAELASNGIPEVVGVAEIQKILDVKSRQQVGQMAEREDFPR